MTVTGTGTVTVTVTVTGTVTGTGTGTGTGIEPPSETATRFGFAMIRTGTNRVSAGSTPRPPTAVKLMASPAAIRGVRSDVAGGGVDVGADVAGAEDAARILPATSSTSVGRSRDWPTPTTSGSATPAVIATGRMIATGTIETRGRGPCGTTQPTIWQPPATGKTATQTPPPIVTKRDGPAAGVAAADVAVDVVRPQTVRAARQNCPEPNRPTPTAPRTTLAETTNRFPQAMAAPLCRGRPKAVQRVAGASLQTGRRPLAVAAVAGAVAVARAAKNRHVRPVNRHPAAMPAVKAAAVGVVPVKVVPRGVPRRNGRLPACPAAVATISCPSPAAMRTTTRAWSFSASRRPVESSPDARPAGRRTTMCSWRAASTPCSTCQAGSRRSGS